MSSSLDAHYKSNLEVHNQLMMVFVQEMNLAQMKLKNQLNSMYKENIALREQLNTASQTIQTIKTELSESYKHMKKQADENASRFAALELHINDLKEINSQKIPLDDYNKKLSTFESSHEKLSSSFSDLQLSQQILENTSYDGHLLWKISAYRQRSKDALSGVVPALHSAPCYTSRFGYKYCLRLYLNGDGAGKGSYISLFFVLMKSDYDSLHRWPFQNRVTFRLRAKNPENDIVESFTPDRNSSSFSKPIREMNIAAGVPLFAKKSDINENFILDDAIYIESKLHL